MQQRVISIVNLQAVSRLYCLLDN